MFRILTFDYNVSQKWLDFKDGCIVGIYLVFFAVQGWYSYITAAKYFKKFEYVDKPETYIYVDKSETYIYVDKPETYIKLGFSKSFGSS